MNSLSILIYLIGFISSIQILTGVAAGIATIFCIIAMIGWIGNSGANYSTDEENADWWAGKLKKWLKFPILLWILFVFIPFDQTIKLIAASEVAEYVLQTDAGKVAIDQAGKVAGKSGAIMEDSLELLHSYILKEIETLKPAPETPKTPEVKT